MGFILRIWLPVLLVVESIVVGGEVRLVLELLSADLAKVVVFQFSALVQVDQFVAFQAVKMHEHL